MAQVSKLHGTDIELVSATIAHYDGGGEGATVWVGTAESRLAASALLDAMVTGIGSAGSSGFTNMKQLSLAQAYNNLNVFQVDGPGGKHYFYLSAKTPERVVWVTVQASNSLAILEGAVKIF